MDVEAYLLDRGRLVDGGLAQVLPPEDTYPSTIHQAMRHSVFAGGKRLRPILVIASAEAVGASAEMVLPTACAVELIHTYSLIHDDLPSMDDSDTRRGRPTCHVVFGEAMAVLAGDALHALAFDLLTRNETAAGPERALRVTQEIARAIGTQGMVGGQVLDLLGEGVAEGIRRLPEPVPIEQLVHDIHRRKTAALICACVRAGGLLAGASREELDALTRYGQDLGLAFQIVDDILDVVGEEAVLGKRAGGDAVQAKLTFPAVFGMQGSSARAREATVRAIGALEVLGPRAELLAGIAGFLLERAR
ncbi:MAG: polyprenyl synthetase family protein [Armatimonadetes bacterium]|nr:polyprenyl synthetase family protein [Armatimonadota bacterium]